MRLWSTVVSQLIRPVFAVGRQRTSDFDGALGSWGMKWDLTVASIGRFF
jgi:hypothetical protein